MLDLGTLVRDNAKVLATMSEVGDALVTKTGCKIYIPLRFAEKKLAIVGKEVKTAGIFAMVVDDTYYNVCNICASMVLTPNFTTIVKFGEEDYYEFIFEKGAVIAPTVESSQDSNLVYRIYDEIIAKAHVPWYLTYADLMQTLQGAEKYGGIWLAANNAPIELIIATISRNRKDVTKNYRHSVKDYADLKNSPPIYVPIGNVLLGAKNTTSRLLGSYLEDGIRSSLNEPTERKDVVETLLRL